MNIQIRRSCLSLVLLSAFIEAIRSNENENNSTDVRRGRVNGRIVKLYTGSKPDPVLCQEEGFKADPVDCSVFYRCTKASSTKFTVFRFQCGPGTVYDPETEICNHPRNTKRSECGGLVSSDSINDENEIEGFELPSPISTIRPVYTSHLELNNITTFTTPSTIELGQSYLSYLTTTSTSYPVVTTTKREVLETSNTLQAYPWINSNNKSNEILTTSSPNTNKGFLCTSDGFIGDNEDCRKFYRCISNSRGGFTRHEFLCSETTVWDDSIQSCNHVWAVRNSPCVKNGFTSNKFGNLKPNTEQPLHYGMKVTQKQNNEIYNEYKVNYDQKINKDDSDKFQDNDVSLVRPPNFVQNEVVNENAQIDLQLNYVNEPSIYETMSSSTETSHNQTLVSNYTERNTECAQTGFMGDPYDCSKFYRCVDNGRGGFSKFEFSCGQGTVWDSKAEACNHAWAVKECAKMYPVKNDPTSTVTTQYQTTNTTVHSNNPTTFPTKYEDKISTISTINEDNNNGYVIPLNQESDVTSSTVLTTISLLSTTASPETTLTECKASGFYGDLNDCEKFYRCVENGKGSFTKYEYKCGQGTLWDQEIEACNHARVVKSCNQNPDTNGTKSTEKYDIQTSTTVSSHIETTIKENSPNNDNDFGYHTPQKSTEKYDIQTSTTVSSHIETTIKENSPNNDNDFGYHTPQIEISGIEKVTDTSTSQTTPKPSDIELNKCQSMGFIGDSKDCKKFYRCVDNGKGGFTQFEFSCGEGTVWDSVIEACNHEWAVKQCGGTKVINISTSSTTTNHDTMNELSNVYTTKTYDTQGTTIMLNLSSQTSTTKSSSECITNGFVGDKYDCKKFYRCVESDNGSFIRYEYLCGDGTAWDPEIQACNHEREVKECSSNTNTHSTQIINEIDVSSTSSPNYNNEVGYTTQTSKQPNLAAGTTKQSSTMTTFMNNINESNNGCQSSGFMGDNYDCKKFYRCVDNGKGGFTKYEFTCGEGTVWDSKIEACNHAWAVEKCGGDNQNETTHSVQIIDSEHKSTTPLHISNVPTQTLQSSSPVYSSTISSMQTEQSASDKENKCTSEGFFANYNDCRRFVRCVNDGKGGYTKFEFDCGEGTVWVQEMQVCDHETDETKCSYSPGTTTDSYKEITEVIPVQTKPVTNNEQVSDGNIRTTMASTTLSTTIKPKPESSTQNVCNEEGYFGDSNNCKKFYRCVNNEKGGYTKYDFTCGEGTIWDQNIVACNHPQDVTSTTCKSENENISSTISNGSTQNMTTSKSTLATTTEKSTISTTISSSEATNSLEPNTPIESSSIPSTSSTSTTSSNEANGNCNNNSTEESKNQVYKCEKAGFYANPNDCKKYYRCVDWESNGQNFSVFHFECGEGTIWDPTLETCNHEDSVYPPRNCNGTQQQNENVTESTTTTEIIYTTQRTTTTPQTTQQTSTTEKSTTQQVTDKTSTQSSQEQTTSISTEQTTLSSTEQSTSSTMEQTTPSSTEQTTSSSTEQTTPSSTEQNTSSSTELTTPSSTEQTTSSSTEQTTSSSTEQTKSSSTEQTTASTTEQTTSSSTEQTTLSSTEESSSSSTEQTTPSTTEQTTSSSTEQTTPSSIEQTTLSSTEQTTSSSTEQTTSASIAETSSVENSTTTESTTGTTQLTSVTNDPITTEKDNTTTEYSSTSDSSTTQMSEVQNTTPATSSQECPKTNEDESLFVCPTSFRRHPKYCNLFYQCIEDNDNHEVKIAVFNCPNNTIYDETKIQCIEEEKSDKKCKGQISQRHRVKRLGSNFNEPMIVTKESMACPTKGHFPFESHEECSEAMLKCQPSKSGKLRGYVYRCPEGFVYWVVSRRCEPIERVKDCKMSSYPWNRRHDLPVENSNIAS